ncbi:MAG TPA: site-specific integrase [Flavobacteriales bacterium]|nr:site-specific integrase [Flavobacteriales bacterium]
MANIEERINKDGSKVFRVKVRRKGHPPQTATFHRKTDANKWSQNTESAIHEGRYFKTTEAKRHTFAEMIKRYCKDILPQKSDVMQTEQSRHLEWWNEQIGDLSLADITSNTISELRDRLLTELGPKGKPRSSATTVRYLAALSHVYSVATREWEWVTDNPTLKVKKPKEPKGRVRFLSDDERGRLLKACKESDNTILYPVVVLALSTGARKMEIMNLTWDDVDLHRGMAILNETKNDERRALPITSHALDVLKDLSKIRRLDTNLLFPRADGQKPIELRSAWDKALKVAQVADFKFHDLRHSAASYLAMNGATLAEIAEVLGHKSLVMVKRYAHLSEQHTHAVVDRMNKNIFGET